MKLCPKNKQVIALTGLIVLAIILCGIFYRPEIVIINSSLLKADHATEEVISTFSGAWKELSGFRAGQGDDEWLDTSDFLGFLPEDITTKDHIHFYVSLDECSYEISFLSTRRMTLASSTCPHSQTERTFIKIKRSGVLNASSDVMTVAPGVKLILIKDLENSGAYNIYNDIFLEKKGVRSRIEVITTDAHGMVIYAPEGDEPEPDSIFTNGYFDHTDLSYHSYGFLPFGMYPCNHDNKYAFYNDRLILVSSTQAKGCKSLTIEKPSDIPNNFDTTRVEVYHISPEVLKQAQK